MSFRPNLEPRFDFTAVKLCSLHIKRVKPVQKEKKKGIADIVTAGIRM